MKPVAAYLDRLSEIRASRRGTPELSYRAALESLLNAVGAEFDPVVRATAELADTGSGDPISASPRRSRATCGPWLRSRGSMNRCPKPPAANR